MFGLLLDCCLNSAGGVRRWEIGKGGEGERRSDALGKRVEQAAVFRVFLGGETQNFWPIHQFFELHLEI